MSAQANAVVAVATEVDYLAVKVGELCPHNDGGTFKKTGGPRPVLVCTKSNAHGRRLTMEESGFPPFQPITVLGPPATPPVVAGEA